MKNGFGLTRYDAFIVDVTEKDRMDRISAGGCAWGDIGSIVPFIIIMGLIMSASGNSGTTIPIFQTKAGFIIASAWQLFFSIQIIKSEHSPPSPARFSWEPWVPWPVTPAGVSWVSSSCLS